MFYILHAVIYEIILNKAVTEMEVNIVSVGNCDKTFYSSLMVLLGGSLCHMLNITRKKC